MKAALQLQNLMGVSMVCVENIGVLCKGMRVHCFHDEGRDGYFWVMTERTVCGVTQFKFTQGCRKYFKRDQ